MDTNNKQETISPYDDSMWDRYSLYDNMPYHWNPDLNALRNFKKISGNLIKSYRCLMKEPYTLKHK